MAAAEHGNGYDPERVTQLVGRIENVLRDIDSIKGSMMEQCKRKHEEIKGIYDEAKEAFGIPKRALKGVVKARGLERKLEELRDNLEDDDQEAFDQLRHALGDLADTPLGAAAEAAAEKKTRRRKPTEDGLNAAAL
jgi:uncharacterized protein (UPF0335 family)